MRLYLEDVVMRMVVVILVVEEADAGFAEEQFPAIDQVSAHMLTPEQLTSLPEVPFFGLVLG